MKKAAKNKAKAKAPMLGQKDISGMMPMPMKPGMKANKAVKKLGKKK